jgi:hypothetical protein
MILMILMILVILVILVIHLISPDCDAVRRLATSSNHQ